MLESITKPKKIKVALEDRPGNNFLRHCQRFKTVREDMSFEDYMILFKPMAKSISNILTIIENHEAQPDDIRDVEVVNCEHRLDIKIKFNRYRNCKLQPIELIVTEFKKGVGLINPTTS